jgi:chorismate mutase
MAADAAGGGDDEFTLASVRTALVRLEDTIIFSLIERAKFPVNCQLYDHDNSKNCNWGSCSLFEFIVKETEAIQAKAGRYVNPEENPFFLDNLPPSLIPSHSYTEFLYPAAASNNINNIILDMYLKMLLPLFVVDGDDGNYAETASSDLVCLQALSRRIHYGKFVAEVKFRGAPQDYEPLIRAKDRDGLMKLLTFPIQEEVVSFRVREKALIFGQDATAVGENNAGGGKYKVEPLVLSRLYVDWVMPLTKEVQVDYLLKRLD